MNKIWVGAFMGEPTSNAAATQPLPTAMVAATAALVAVTIAIALGSGPIYAFAERAAETLLPVAGSAAP
jgi:multicomponent Na+:H+ antiporter subunit D